MNSAGRVDVIVPVYKNLELTRRCLESVLTAECKAGYDLVVIDDASPEPTLAAYLDELDGTGRITLIRHAINRGFVATVNEGMALHGDRDVVLLNSDTEVTGDWLDRLVASANSDPCIATVTPFSNNATICSYPFDGWGETIPGELGLPGLDTLFARTQEGVVVDLPTAVGFCMFIRRECLAAIGCFDEDAFGRGYGEENDFCLRAAKAGWRNVLCGSLFVAHHGGASFGAERVALMHEASRTLLRRHPDYTERVAAFLAADPLAGIRSTIDDARAACSSVEAAHVVAERRRERELKLKGALSRSVARQSEARTAIQVKPEAGLLPRYVGMSPDAAELAGIGAPQGLGRLVLLHVAHSWGGGVERWVRDFAAGADGYWSLLLRSRSWRNHAGVRIELVDVLADQVLSYWDLSTPISACSERNVEYKQVFEAVIGMFDVKAVFISSLIGHDIAAMDSGKPTAMILHDLFPFCPALFGWFGSECTDCTVERLGDCLKTNPLNVFWHVSDTRYWMEIRSALSARLESGTVAVVAPSHSVLARYQSLMPALLNCGPKVVPHGLGWEAQQMVIAPTKSSNLEGRPLRVIVPGRLSPHKGLALLERVLPLVSSFAEVCLMGCGEFGRAFEKLPHVIVIPEYVHEALPELVRAYDPDCALIASMLPESFSYTLSEMQALGVPVLASRLGALAERIDDRVTGFLVEPVPDEIVSSLKRLSDDRPALASVAARLRAQAAPSLAGMVEAYLTILGLHIDPQPARPQVCLEALLRNQARERARADLHELRLSAANDLYAKLQLDHLASMNQIAALSHRLACEQAEHDADRARLRSVEMHRDTILASTSWRVTRPLRRLRELGLAEHRERIELADGVQAPQMAESKPVCPTWRLRINTGSPINRKRARLIGDRLGLSDASFVPMDATDASDRSWIRAGIGLLIETEPDPNCCSVRRITCADLSNAGEAESPIEPYLLHLVPTLGVRAAHFEKETHSTNAVIRIPGGSIGEWTDLAVISDRQALRTKHREMLGVADEMRIFLSMGYADGNSGFARFARLATNVCELRNGCCFVWLGGIDPVFMTEAGDEVMMPIALRRLFVANVDEFEPWLLAADGYLDCSRMGRYDPGVWEAVAAGLPVFELAEQRGDAERGASENETDLDRPSEVLLAALEADFAESPRQTDSPHSGLGETEAQRLRAAFAEAFACAVTFCCDDLQSKA